MGTSPGTALQARVKGTAMDPMFYIQFMSPEEGGGGEPAPADPSPKPSEGSDPTPKDNAGGDPKQDPTPKPRNNPEVGRMIGIIKNLQAENAKLKEGKTGEPATVDNPLDHPALKGLKTNDDGEVLYHGAWVPPEYAIKHAETESRLADLEDKFKGKESDEAANKLAGAHQKLYAAISDSITESRKDAFPDITDAAEADDIDELIAMHVDKYLEAKLADGEELSEVLISESISKAIERITARFGRYGVKQFIKNTEHREANPTKPKGSPGTEAEKNYLQERNLSKQDRRKNQEERTRLAESMRVPH